MGLSRADIVMVIEGSVVGIEIKSDADTYARLSRQVRDYDKYYDRNYVVVGSTHALHVGEHIPEYWGIVSVEEMDGGIDFYKVRDAKINPKLKLDYKLELMWRPELVQIQKHFNMPKYNDKSKRFVIKAIADRTKLPEEHKNHIPIGELNYQISELLFERDYSTIGQKIQEYRKNR